MLRNLATAYDVMDSIDGTTSKVFVIASDELYKVMESIPLKSKKPSVRGIKSTPYDITWYCAESEELVIENAVAQAKMDGNDTVVIELLSQGSDVGE
jgi:hypothetical protein